MQKTVLFLGIVVLILLGFVFFRASIEDSNTQEKAVEQSNSTVDAAVFVATKQLVGDWEVANHFYETISLRDDGSFSVYLGNQLLYGGTWYANKEKIVLETAVGPTQREELVVLSHENGVIRFNSEERPVEWTKIN